jgi:pectin methylesterase-like acyl-CoA thioesterase
MTTRSKLKILDSVIGSNTIDVMNTFKRFESSSEIRGHYETVFQNPCTVFISKWMTYWKMNTNITIFVYAPSTIPIGMILSGIIRKTSLL